MSPRRRSLAGAAASRLAPKVTDLAPGATSAFVREALNRAILGIGPLPPAAKAADEQLREQKGDVGRAIHEVIENHVRYAGGQGLLTNIGGIVSAAVTVPANITGLALIQCRMVAGIAHLRGHDLADPRVRNAILTVLMGEDTVDRLVRTQVLPAGPAGLITAEAVDPTLDRTITGQVAQDLLTRVAGKRMAVTVGRRVPVVGGVVGMGADGYATWKLGRYAERVLPVA
ncbi:EcsC family protein [Nocardioides sp. TRM66260-LWL]|uniref:EcsC family protein n=1 Tax=Nocardioides sp. TRM66260-LWL TaxID=2874478 RepID=UPI001CC3E0BF|nr:EcsC family protein [Nocardioides sp. TRM66260-LWL]MBZ5735625.1 EcsC family protein [Nocardioides sp. TRM66260-LWL]